MNRPFPIQPVSLADPLPKGMAFVRACIATALHPEQPHAAERYAASRWGEDSIPERICKAMFRKASVGAASSSEIGFQETTGVTEFVGAVRAQSIIGPMLANGLRRRPMRTRYLVNQGTMRGTFVGEGDGIPVLPFSFEQATLDLLKVAGIAVLTKESLESADPATEIGIRNDIISGLAEALDTAFIDPTNAGAAGVSPASVTNGITPVAIGTGDADDVRDGITRMIEDFTGDLTRAVFVGSPQLFATLNAYGYDDVGIRGGTLVGAPAYATKGLPNASGFYQLALIDPTAIAFAEDADAAEIVASQQAAIQMADNPTVNSVEPTGVSTVSLWQTNSVALKGTLYANWSVERAGAVSLMLAFPEAPAS